MIGRDNELERVRATFDRGLAGPGCVLVIEGEAGIGKSSLLEAVLEGAPGLFLRGAARELEQERPFGLLLEALATMRDSGSSADTGASTVLQLLQSGASGFQLSDEIVDTLERASVGQQVVLALEDLHWADAASLRTIAQLVERLTFNGICLVATTRFAPRSDDLRTLLASIEGAGGERIELSALDQDTAFELARREFGAKLPTAVEHMIGRAGGNPLYVIELVNALREERSISEGELPPSLRLTILRRLSFLSDPTIELLRLAAILGEDFQVEDLCAFAEQTAVEVATLLREALDARVLHPAGDDRLAFRHELVRDAVYQDVPAAVRRALHAQAGHALATRGAPPSRVATHLSLGDAADAVPWLRRAAREALDVDTAVGVELLRRARSLLDEHDPQRVEVLRELGVAYVMLARPAESMAAIEEGLAMRPDPRTVRSMRRLQASALAQLGRAAEGDRIWDDVELDASEPDHAWDLAARAQSRISVGDVDAAIRDAQAALAISTRLADPRGSVWAASTLAQIALWHGDTHRVIELCEQAPTGTEFESAFAPDLRGQVHLFHALALGDADRFDEAEAISRTLRRVSETVMRRPYAHVERGSRLYRAGAFDEARAELEAGFAVAIDQGPTLRPLVCAYLLRLAVHTEDVALAARMHELLSSDLAANVVPSQERSQCRWALAADELWRGDEAAGARLLARSVRFKPGFLGNISALGLIAPDGIKQLVAAGDVHVAEELAEQIEHQADRLSGVPSARGLMLRCRGLATSDCVQLRDAVDAYRASPKLLDLAFVLEEAGELTGGIEGARMLEEATALFTQMGAPRDVRRIEASLRALGVRRSSKGPRARPSIGWDSLTPTELTVVDLLCEGLTNRRVGERLFISTRTVDAHVSHIFRKLGVASRTELVSMAITRRQDIGQHAQ